MNLMAVCDRLRAASVDLFVGDDGKLRAVGSAASLSRVRNLIREHCDRLVALLTAPACPGCGRPTDEFAICWRCHDRPCRTCGNRTGSAYLGTCTPCGQSTRNPASDCK